MANVNANAQASSRGVGFLGLLTVVFVILKLDPGNHLSSDVEKWSWWWVFSPLWIPTVLSLVVLGVVLAGAALLDAHDTRKRKKARRARLANRR